MRNRLALTLLVLIPALASAQRGRVVPPQTTSAPRPAEKPPLAPGIPDSRLYTQYRLSRFSFEQYPMLTALQTTGVIAPGVSSDNTMFGDGSHLSFRVAPSLSLTADMTSAFFGAPFSMGSLDLGLRVKPWTAHRIRPYIDARTSYAYTIGVSGISQVVPVVAFVRAEGGDATSGSGNGTLLGLGAETNVNRNFILSASLSATRYAMNGQDLSSRLKWNYTADAFRLGVGLRYNPGKWYE